MNSTQKFIVWDWNGTVIADHDAVLQATNKVLAYKNKPELGIDRFREIYDMPVAKFYANSGFSAIEIEQHFAAMNALFYEHLEILATQSPLREGWKELAIILGTPNISNIILSNTLISYIEFHAERLGTRTHFDHILANEDQSAYIKKISKKDKLRDHIHEHGLSTEHGIIIGDTPEEADIGREIGIPSVLITGGYASQSRLEAAGPNYLIHSLHELPPILRERGFLS